MNNNDYSNFTISSPSLYTKAHLKPAFPWRNHSPLALLPKGCSFVLHWQVALSCLHSPELLPAQTPLSAPKAPVHLRLLWSSSPLLAEVIYPLPSHLLITGNSGVGPLYPPKLAGVTPASLDAIRCLTSMPLWPSTVTHSSHSQPYPGTCHSPDLLSLSDHQLRDPHLLNTCPQSSTPQCPSPP